MFKRLAIVFALITTGLFTSVVPAHAVIPASCIFDSVRITSSTTVETYTQWVKRQKLQINNNACFQDTKGLNNIYSALQKKAILDLQQRDKNEFNKRYDACTKGVGISLSPSTWLTSLKCLFTTSFFPTSDTLKVKFNDLMGDFKSHQPTSYIPIALGVITNLKDNWGGTDCRSGDIGMSTTIPNLNKKLDFIVPCKPATPLQMLRNLMVLSVWIGFAFWLYRTGVQFWKERSA